MHEFKVKGRLRQTRCEWPYRRTAADVGLTFGRLVVYIEVLNNFDKFRSDL